MVEEGSGAALWQFADGRDGLQVELKEMKMDSIKRQHESQRNGYSSIHSSCRTYAKRC